MAVAPRRRPLTVLAETLEKILKENKRQHPGPTPRVAVQANSGSSDHRRVTLLGVAMSASWELRSRLSLVGSLVFVSGHLEVSCSLKEIFRAAVTFTVTYFRVPKDAEFKPCTTGARDPRCRLPFRHRCLRFLMSFALAKAFLVQKKLASFARKRQKIRNRRVKTFPFIAGTLFIRLFSPRRSTLIRLSGKRRWTWPLPLDGPRCGGRPVSQSLPERRMSWA